MPSPDDPLRLEYGDPVGRLRVVRQPPPAGAASFSATYVGPAGWGFDAPGQGGVARVVNQLIATASRRYDRVALARRLDRAGATLAHQTSPEAAELTIWGPAEDATELLGLLGEIVETPRFDPDDVARARRQLLERQLRQRTQPAGRADFELLRGVFPPGHPYRESGLGDRRSAAGLAPSRLARFHRDHYTGGEASVVVTTREPLATVERTVHEAFSEIADRAGPRLTLPDLRPAAPRRIEINLPGRSQVEVRVGGPSIAQSSPDYPAAFLANEVLGGRPMLARLFQRVREQNGLAYHASSQLDLMRFGGIWTASAGTGADRWRRVVPMLEEEVARVRDTSVSPGELRSVRESAIGEVPLSLESTADAHELAVDAAYHELPADYWARWPGLLRSVAPRDLRRAASAAFDRRRSVTVVVGPIASG